MNLMELFKSFHARAIVNKYPPSVRALYDALLFDFNAKYWPEHCIYSERALGEMAGLSKTTTHEALCYLAERGHVTVRTGKRQTVIRLVDTGNRRATDNRPIADQSPTDSRPIADQPSGLSITRTRKDTDIRQDNNTVTDGARARTDTVNADDGLVAVWLENHGAYVTAELLSYLSTLVNRFGRERTEELIRSAARKFGGGYRMSPDFLQKHVAILEGGSTRDKVVPINTRREKPAVNQQYAQPDTRYDAEFGL